MEVGATRLELSGVILQCYGRSAESFQLSALLKIMCKPLTLLATASYPFAHELDPYQSLNIGFNLG